MAKTQPYHHGNLRAELLKAAEKELSEKGLEAFSMRGVAKRAGVSHNAPGHHFADVNALLTALATTGFKRLLATQTARQKHAKSSPLNQFIALGLGYVDFATENPAMFRLMFSSSQPDRTDADLAAAMASAFLLLSQEAGKLAPSGSSRSDLESKNIMAAWAMVHGLGDLMNSGLLDVMIDSQDHRDELLSDILMRLTFDPEHHEDTIQKWQG